MALTAIDGHSEMARTLPDRRRCRKLLILKIKYLNFQEKKSSLGNLNRKENHFFFF